MTQWDIKIFVVFPLPSGYQLQTASWLGVGAFVHWKHLGNGKTQMVFGEEKLESRQRVLW